MSPALQLILHYSPGNEWCSAPKRLPQGWREPNKFYPELESFLPRAAATDGKLEPSNVKVTVYLHLPSEGHRTGLITCCPGAWGQACPTCWLQCPCAPSGDLRTGPFYQLPPLLAPDHVTWMPEEQSTQTTITGAFVCHLEAPASTAYCHHHWCWRTNKPGILVLSRTSPQHPLTTTDQATGELISTTDAANRQRKPKETTILCSPRNKAKKSYSTNTINTSIRKSISPLKSTHKIVRSNWYTRCADINVKTQKSMKKKEKIYL